MIEIKDVSYNVVDNDTKLKKEILKDLSVCFPQNKITVITGHNGSGKSTLIKLLMGLNKVSSGKIIYNGKDITNLSICDRANMGFTIAFQKPVCFKGLTVKDVLNIANKKDNKLDDACEILSKVGLCAKDYLDRELSDSLSGGELKRIELAIALCKGGDVFLFDEPEAGIDIWSFDGLVNIFKSLQNKTVIIVSHQKKILDIADYILLLNSKNGAKFGTREEMLDSLQTTQCKGLGGNV